MFSGFAVNDTNQCLVVSSCPTAFSVHTQEDFFEVDPDTLAYIVLKGLVSNDSSAVPSNIETLDVDFQHDKHLEIYVNTNALSPDEINMLFKVGFSKILEENAGF